MMLTVEFCGLEAWAPSETHRGVRIIVDLGGFCYASQCGVFQAALNVLCCLTIFRGLTQQVHRQRRRLYVFGQVDNLHSVHMKQSEPYSKLQCKCGSR